MNCPLCHHKSSFSDRLKPKDYEYGITTENILNREIVSCPNCELKFLFPHPTTHEISHFYPTDYDAYGESRNYLMGKIFEYYNVFEAKRVHSLIHTKYASVLDVGCGEGGFLHALNLKNKNLKLFGLELNALAAQKAKKRGFSIQNSLLEEANFPENSFELIRMNHVIEHFIHPQHAISILWKALKPGGLLIGETPNVSSLDFWLFRKYWGALHFPRHIWMFTPNSLDKLLSQEKFKKIWIRNCFRTVGWTGSIQNWLVDKVYTSPPEGGRFTWYPLLIPPFLLVTLTQAAISQTASMRFLYQKT